MFEPAESYFKKTCKNKYFYRNESFYSKKGYLVSSVEKEELLKIIYKYNNYAALYTSLSFGASIIKIKYGLALFFLLVFFTQYRFNLKIKKILACCELVSCPADGFLYKFKKYGERATWKELRGQSIGMIFFLYIGYLLLVKYLLEKRVVFLLTFIVLALLMILGIFCFFATIYFKLNAGKNSLAIDIN